ncbi:MAG: hypothetical protein VB018_09400 [Lachnospiraceae bacterium]|nr:hypothetical protein [Lachnospiraceae bacterium]
MVTNIILGIAEKIRTRYAQGGYKLYTESIKQGFEEPCFFVQLITQVQTQRLGNRYMETYSFDIQYFPNENGGENKECLDVSEELYELLEYIAVNEDLLRGMSLNSRVQDRVLHFFVDYVVPVVRTKAEEEKMEEVIIYGETKEW